MCCAWVITGCVLQGVYKEELQQHFGIVFNNLFCLNNMPIKRYVDYLQRRNKLEEYMQVSNPVSVFACLFHLYGKLITVCRCFAGVQQQALYTFF